MNKLAPLVFGLWASHAVYAVAKFGVADILAARGKSLTSAEIALDIQEDINIKSLFRLLRYTSSLGIFELIPPTDPEDLEYEKTYKFGLNETSQFLREGIEGSLRSFILMEAGAVPMKVWSGSLESFKTGKSAVTATTGYKSIWQYMEQHPAQQQLFNDAMTCYSSLEIVDTLKIYDFSGISSLVDIGGGHGKVLFTILRKYPDIKKGYIYDLPVVTHGIVVPDDLKDRVEVHSGSFLDEHTNIPSGADVYLMKHIIHDWDDEKSEVILKATRKAMGNSGKKVLLLEYVVPEGPEPSFSKAMDLHMMVMLGAKERTQHEYSALFAKAGFSLTQVVRAANVSFNLVEAIPSSS